jgi:2-oxo-4-hydroxy-4-carboxy--5-ureidoimidazoline (OHCU) decarboxylase
VDQPNVAELDRLPADEFSAAVAPLFEGGTCFLARLATRRPFGTAQQLFDEALDVALRMPEAEQIELVDAHPRLGAPPGSVSAMSFAEQGYDRDAADAAAEAKRTRVDAELADLNNEYERRFGFRYCVFVAGRTRAELIPDFRLALGRPRDEELRRALHDVVAIARARFDVARRGAPVR